MSLLLYNIFLFLYGRGIRLAALFNEKARLWVEGRRNWQEQLRAAMAQEPGRPTVWMHSASLGEFEQGRPLLEYIRKTYPQYRILVSFFSPSGYTIRKDWPGADIVTYLPLDNYRHARSFVEIVQPALVLWVRYDFWYYTLNRLQKNKTPVILVSGHFRASQPFFKWYGNLHRHMLHCFRMLFVQDASSVDLLRTAGISNVQVSGDTRFDRVSALKADGKTLPAVEAFIRQKPVLVAGSTWQEDEEELDHYANTHPEICFILAPHEISEAHLVEIEKLFTGTIRYSVWEKEYREGKQAGPQHVLIIDNIGMLAYLYRYARVAFVGGGFGDDGLHNILEPAAWGVPVVFGPETDGYPEAPALIDAGGAFAVDHALELEKCLDRLFTDEGLQSAAATAAGKFVAAQKGATETILHYLEENRLLTN